MNSFADIVSRYSPTAWFDRGLTVRDDVSAVRAPRWYMDVGTVRRGIVGVAAVGLVAAGVVIGGQDSPATVTAVDPLFAQATIPGAIAFSEVPEGHWPKMIDRIRAAKPIDESAYMDMDSII